MGKRSKYVWFRFNSVTKPVIEIEDGVDQVFIRLIPYGAEHITIHLGKDGTLTKNYSVPYTVEPVWKENVHHIAKDIFKWNRWREHDKYVFNNLPLVKFANANGYHLISKLIDLNTYKPKTKYVKHCDLEVIVPCPRFLLKMYLSTADNPCNSQLDKIEVAFGDICFGFEGYDVAST